MIVVDKQPDLVVHPGAGNPSGTLAQGIVARYPEVAAVGDPTRPGIVHRLDRGTSGLLVVARTEAARGSLVAQLASRQVTRRYLALTWGHLESARGVVDAPIGRSKADLTRMAVTNRGKRARTAYQVEQRFPSRSRPTWWRPPGRRAGPTRSGCTSPPSVTRWWATPATGGVRESLDAPRPFLHARHLAFDHPATGARVRFDAELPADLAAVAATLVPTADVGP